MMQDSLFDSIPIESNETLELINAEMLDKAKQLPMFAERVFVFGVGKSNAKIVIVGESPGPPDAEFGEPFRGPVGELLEKILLAIGLSRRNCYLTNVVKYISQGDELTPEILSFFTPYLHREIAVIKPQVIISLGNTPTKALLNTKKAISQVRGEFHDYQGIKLMPTFNPAYLLRDASKKREVWEDMKKVRDYLAKTT
ncbi:MAG TPA: uracil-DNA glycosylase [Pyrinomonadaceae bacterium]|nr:uracil-DNA glycosylase [Pyrinomonadaceae bacterium]